MKTTKIIFALAILAATGGAYAAGAADNSWLMQTPVGQQQPSASGDTSTPDPISMPINAE